MLPSILQLEVFKLIHSLSSICCCTVAYFAHDRCYANMNSPLFEINRLIIDGKVTKVLVIKLKEKLNNVNGEKIQPALHSAGTEAEISIPITSDYTAFSCRNVYCQFVIYFCILQASCTVQLVLTVFECKSC